MNYKNICQFLIYCFIAIFSSVLLVFLMSEVFGVKRLYTFLQEQGSLIAGVIGFAGVFILISNQNKTTRKMIDSNMEVMKSEAFEIKRSGALDCAASIRADIHSLTRFALVNKKLDCSELSEQKIYRILKSSYQLNTFLGENLEDQKSLVNLIIEYTNLYMAVCMDDNVNMQNLPSIVIARMYTVGRHLNALNIRICIDDLIYDSLECFFSDYSQSDDTEGAIAITKYLQIYIDAKVAPEISQRISDKLL